MSPWSTIAFCMALFSAVMYTCLSAYNILGFLLYHKIMTVPEMDDDPDIQRDENRPLLEYIKVNGPYTFTYVAELIVYIVMLLASILLAVGVNKQRHQFMSPWLILACIYVGIGFCTTVITANSNYVLDFIVIGLQTFMWFPVYTCYKKMRHNRCRRQTGVISSYALASRIKTPVFLKVGFSVSPQTGKAVPTTD